MDIDAPAACDSGDSSDTWWMGVRRLAVANGPNIFQMLLVIAFDLRVTEATQFVDQSQCTLQFR